MDEATRICARLLREGSVARAALPDLDFPEVRHEVERRFQAVGLVLATSVYSEHVGIRLSADVTGDSAFDAASNLGLRSDTCALLVILWARLVLQKRTAADTRELPGQSALFSRERSAAAREYRPRVRLETLVREFRPVLGGRSRILSLVTQLRRLGFLAGHGEVIEAGPLLELAVDGERMIAFLRREVLAKLLEERERAPGEGGEGADESADEDLLAGFGGRVLEAIGRLGGTAAMGELARLTEAPASRLRRLLRDLEAAGYVRRTGERASARYHLVPPVQEPEKGEA